MAVEAEPDTEAKATVSAVGPWCMATWAVTPALRRSTDQQLWRGERKARSLGLVLQQG